MVDLDMLGVQVLATLADKRDGKAMGWGEIRFRCPCHDDAHPSADYDPAKHSWVCRSCGAGGGLIAGANPLAPLLGLTDAAPVVQYNAASLAMLDAERARARAQLAADKAAKAEALRDYWAAHHRVKHGEAHLRMLDGLLSEGITALAADAFGFEPGAFAGTPALVIPWTVRGEIRAVQYRLPNGAEGGRYRWHKGSRPTIYNADAVLTPQEDTILVVEGAKKCAALWSHGIVSVCAIANKGAWKAEYAKPFGRFARVVFALDPDAWRESAEAAATVAHGRTARLPMKPDDMLLALRGDVDAFWRYIERARQAVSA